MPRIQESKKLTESVTVRLTKSDFDRLQMLADQQRLPLAEWSRDRLLEVLNGTISDGATLLAEIAATQNITISLLYSYARDGQLPEARVRETLDRARREKYAQAAELQRQAASAVGSVTRPTPAISDKAARQSL